MLHFLKIFCFMATLGIIVKFGVIIGIFAPGFLLLLVLLTIYFGKKVF